MVKYSVTAIIPSFNRKHTLGRCLDSVLMQTRLPDEIIVIDDGSTDGTINWLAQSYPVVKVLSQENAGVSSARNKGIREAKSEWIAFLDSDDEWLPEKLELQLEALNKNSEYRICHTEENWIFRGKTRAVAKPYLKKGGWIFEHCLPLCAISPSTVVAHKSIFKEWGMFDESFPVCEDYDLWLRLTSQLPVLLVDEPLINKHGGGEDQLSQQRGLDEYRVKALVKLLEGDSLSVEQRQITVNELLRKCRICLQGAVKYGRAQQEEYFQSLINLYDGSAIV